MSIQNVIAFTVGAILGAGACIYILKDKYVPKEEYDDLIEYCENKLKDESKRTEQHELAASSDMEESDTDKNEKKQKYFGYDALSKDTGDQMDVTRYGYDTISKVTEKSELKSLPHVISDEDYYDDTNGYDKQILHYFSQDDLLTNEANEPIDIETVGEQALKRFGEFEADTVFVRDETKEIDYQVIDEHVCYYDDGENL